jgi:hypothetical protein
MGALANSSDRPATLWIISAGASQTQRAPEQSRVGNLNGVGTNIASVFSGLDSMFPRQSFRVLIWWMCRRVPQNLRGFAMNSRHFRCIFSNFPCFSGDNTENHYGDQSAPDWVAHQTVLSNSKTRTF